MSVNATHFAYADRGATSVYKFRFEGGDDWFVWFESDGAGSLHRTANGGPYRVEDSLQPVEFEDLDALLTARGTNKEQWVKDLMAQFGERLAWTYP